MKNVLNNNNNNIIIKYYVTLWIVASCMISRILNLEHNVIINDLQYYRIVLNVYLKKKQYSSIVFK